MWGGRGLAHCLVGGWVVGGWVVVERDVHLLCSPYFIAANRTVVVLRRDGIHLQPQLS